MAASVKTLSFIVIPRGALDAVGTAPPVIRISP
jgi:hypothetical protein